VAVALAGPYANHLHLAPVQADDDTSTSLFNFFIGWMLFLVFSQQCQSIEGNKGKF